MYKYIAFQGKYKIYRKFLNPVIFTDKNKTWPKTYKALLMMMVIMIIIITHPPSSSAALMMMVIIDDSDDDGQRI